MATNTKKTNANELAVLIANTALTAVNNARLNECTALTTDKQSIEIVTQFARLDSFDSKYTVRKCAILSEMRKTLKDEKELSFRKACDIFGIDNSNAGKMADIWEKFYGRAPELYGEYSVGQLTPFSSKRIDDVDKVFNSNEITPMLTVSKLRTIASAIDSKNGIIDNGKILDTLNGIEETKKTKTETKTETETAKNGDVTTQTEKTEKAFYSIGDIITIYTDDYIIEENEDGTYILVKYED